LSRRFVRVVACGVAAGCAGEVYGLDLGLRGSAPAAFTGALH
jgi:hypothetical protein